MSSRSVKTTAVLVLVTGLLSQMTRGESTFDDAFDSEQTIERLAIRVDVGSGGGDLNEPIALDLGLGFPFWLHPVGLPTSDSAPLGAIPQDGFLGRKVSAGSSAHFLFRNVGDPGQDRLRITPRLLAGVRVSDISRIGFIGQGTSDWELAGYEIRINNKVLATGREIGLTCKQVQDAARMKLAKLKAKSGPLEDQAGDIRALAEVKLASESDLAELMDLEKQIAELGEQIRRLESQIAGEYPWYEDAGFHPLWRKPTHIGSATVRLVTETHNGADTKNYIYFGTGGHKYILNPLQQPLSGLAGGQDYSLDLLAGPLTSADLRGFSVGMLAGTAPYADAPDRWHPQRILVEIDGHYVYDSDESPVDRSSLRAIRVIPPAHLNGEGVVVINTPTLRETFCWEAGKGAGLDLKSGGALPLPPPGEQGAPGAEPTPGGNADGGENMPGADDADESGADESGSGDSGSGGFPPFPGEGDDGDWSDLGGGSGGGNWPGDPGSGNMGGGNLGLGNMGGGSFPWLDWIIGSLLKDLGILLPGTDPDPWGKPFQLKKVAFANGWKQDDEFTIQWSVSGTEANVDYYEIGIARIQPNQADPFPAGQVYKLGTLPRGSRQWKGTLGMFALPIAGLSFCAPSVIAHPIGPNESPVQRLGPARAIFAQVKDPALHALELDHTYGVKQGNVLIPGQGITVGSPPPASGRAVWVAGQLESHNAILFDKSTPALNIVARPEAGDTELSIFLRKPNFSGKHRVSARIGFLGLNPGGNSVEVELRCVLTSADGKLMHVYAVETETLSDSAGGLPTPMKLVEQVIDASQAGFAAGGELMIWFKLKTNGVNPDNPPALVGVAVTEN